MLVFSVFDPSTGDENSIPTLPNLGQSHRLSQSTLHLVPYYSLTDPFAHQKTKAAVAKPVREDTDYQQMIRRAAAFLVELGEPFTASQPGPTLHRWRCGLNRQPVASFEPPPPQYCLAIRGLGTRPEPVNPGPAPLFGLIGAFWHDSVTPQ